MLSLSTLEYLPDKKPTATLSSEESTLKKTKLKMAIKLILREFKVLVKYLYRLYYSSKCHGKSIEKSSAEINLFLLYVILHCFYFQPLL